MFINFALECVAYCRTMQLKNRIMKKLFFAAVALATATFVAQAQIHPRIEVAGNFAKRSVTDSKGDTQSGYKMRPGFRASVAAEIGLAAGLYIAPGITFRQEGSKLPSNKSEALNYLSVPVDLGIRAQLDDTLAVSVEVGPSFAYGVSSSGTGEDAFKTKKLGRFDVSLNASAALEYNKLYLRVGTDIGVVNTLKEAVQKATAKNTSFFVGVGYRF